VKTHHEAGVELLPGHADSSPVEFRAGRLLLRAAVLAALATVAYVANYLNGWITAQDLIFWGPTVQ